MPQEFFDETRIRILQWHLTLKPQFLVASLTNDRCHPLQLLIFLSKGITTKWGKCLKREVIWHDIEFVGANNIHYLLDSQLRSCNSKRLLLKHLCWLLCSSSRNVPFLEAYQEHLPNIGTEELKWNVYGQTTHYLSKRFTIQTKGDLTVSLNL